MNPTRSANSTVTWRRSAAAGVAGKEAATGAAAGARAAAPSRGTPHCPQNRCPGSFAAPQEWHAICNGDPHWPQKRWPGRLSVPHAAQVTCAGYFARRGSANRRAGVAHHAATRADGAHRLREALFGATVVRRAWSRRRPRLWWVDSWTAVTGAAAAQAAQRLARRGDHSISLEGKAPVLRAARLESAARVQALPGSLLVRLDETQREPARRRRRPRPATRPCGDLRHGASLAPATRAARPGQAKPAGLRSIRGRCDLAGIDHPPRPRAGVAAAIVPPRREGCQSIGGRGRDRTRGLLGVSETL